MTAALFVDDLLIVLLPSIFFTLADYQTSYFIVVVQTEQFQRIFGSQFRMRLRQLSNRLKINRFLVITTVLPFWTAQFLRLQPFSFFGAYRPTHFRDRPKLKYWLGTRRSLTNKTRCHAVAGRTARCRYNFRHNGIVHAVTLVQHGFLV